MTGDLGARTKCRRSLLAAKINDLDSRLVSRVLSRRVPVGCTPPTVIYLGRRLLAASSSLPEHWSGQAGPRAATQITSDLGSRVCSVWPCSGWGLPSQRVAPLLVRSYRTVSPLPRQFDGGSWPAPMPCGMTQKTPPRRFTFCCTFPSLAAGRRYRPSCPLEPGLSSHCPCRIDTGNRRQIGRAHV